MLKRVFFLINSCLPKVLAGSQLTFSIGSNISEVLLKSVDYYSFYFSLIKII